MSALTATVLRADVGSGIALRNLFNSVALYLLVTAMMSSAKPKSLVLRSIQKTYCYAVSLVAVASLSLAFRGVIRPKPFGLDANYAGYLMAVALPMSERWNGWVWTAYRSVLILAVLSTGSRTALVELIAWALFTGWIRLVTRRSRQHKLILVGIVIVCAAVAIVQTPPDLMSRLAQSKFGVVSDISGRIQNPA